MLTVSESLNQDISAFNSESSTASLSSHRKNSRCLNSKQKQQARICRRRIGMHLVLGKCKVLSPPSLPPPSYGDELQVEVACGPSRGPEAESPVPYTHFAVPFAGIITVVIAPAWGVNIWSNHIRSGSFPHTQSRPLPVKRQDGGGCTPVTWHITLHHRSWISGLGRREGVTAPSQPECFVEDG
jgi:hypothetical protein